MWYIQVLKSTESDDVYFFNSKEEAKKAMREIYINEIINEYRSYQNEPDENDVSELRDEVECKTLKELKNHQFDGNVYDIILNEVIIYQKNKQTDKQRHVPDDWCRMHGPCPECEEQYNEYF